MNSIDCLSNEVLINLFSFLTPTQVLKVQRVCKRWKVIGDDDYLWGFFLKKIYCHDRIEGLSNKEIYSILVPKKHLWQTIESGNNSTFSTKIVPFFDPSSIPLANPKYASNVSISKNGLSFIVTNEKNNYLTFLFKSFVTSYWQCWTLKTNFKKIPHFFHLFSLEKGGYVAVAGPYIFNIEDEGREKRFRLIYDNKTEFDTFHEGLEKDSYYLANTNERGLKWIKLIKKENEEWIEKIVDISNLLSITFQFSKKAIYISSRVYDPDWVEECCITSFTPDLVKKTLLLIDQRGYYLKDSFIRDDDNLTILHFPHSIEIGYLKSPQNFKLLKTISLNILSKWINNKFIHFQLFEDKLLILDNFSDVRLYQIDQNEVKKLCEFNVDDKATSLIISPEKFIFSNSSGKISECKMIKGFKY